MTEFKARAEAIESVEESAWLEEHPLIMPSRRPAHMALPQPDSPIPVPVTYTYPVAVFQEQWQQKPNGIQPGTRKAAVLCGNRIRDYIFALPALNALRLAYPETEIVLLGEDWQKEFLTGRPGPIDRIEVVPMQVIETKAGQIVDPESAEFLRKMAAENFDIAIQLQGSRQQANLFLNKLHARMTAGAREPDSAMLDRWVPHANYQLDSLRNLEVVSLIGAKPVSLEARVFVTKEDLEQAEPFLPKDGRQLVVIHPGASDPRRRWSVDQFAGVADALTWAGAQVVITGSRSENEIAASVTRRMQAKPINACGRLSLKGLTGLLSKAALVIGNDNGILHLASATGAATIGIYWCANLMTSGPTTRSRHRPAISWRVNCPVCGLDVTRSNCEHQVSFVDDISKEEVVVSAIDLLKKEVNPLRIFLP